MPKTNKKYFLFLLAIFSFGFTIGQSNLVPNGSFETYTSCPNSQGQVSKASGWSIARLTADYFNTCSTYTSTVGIPTNGAGYQYPASGNAYMGFYGYIESLATMKRESIGCQLTSTLSIGTKYYVSFKINLSSIDPSLCFIAAIDHLGALFSTVPFNVSSPSPINNFAQVYGNTIISDTINWKQIFGSFVADSAYKYITLGNFFNNSNTNANFFYTCSDTGAYYFWDDICVSTDSLFTENWYWTGIENKSKENEFFLFPNPASNYISIKNNEPESFEVKIYDAFGQLLFYEKNCFTETIIKVEDIPPQTLFVKIIKDNKVYNYKLIKI